MDNPEVVENLDHVHTPSERETARRSAEERREYIDGTLTYMCGAPIFEFGLWPYVPYIGVMLLSTALLWLYKETIELEYRAASSYLVVGMGFLLSMIVIVSLALDAKRNIEQYAQRKKRKKKQVLSVEPDESKRGYIVRQDVSGTYSAHRRDTDAHMRKRAPTTIDRQESAYAVDNQASSRMLQALNRANGASGYNLENGERAHAREEVDVEEQREYPMDASEVTFDKVPSMIQRKTFQAIVRALTSKLLEAGVMMAIVFVWLVYGMIFVEHQDFFPVSVHMGLSALVFMCVLSTYIQSWYDNIGLRYFFVLVWAGAMLFDPTSLGNVPSSGSTAKWVLMVRLQLFFLVYGIAEADTTSQINYWLRFCNRKKLIRNLPKLVTPPMEQIDTPGKRRMYAIQRIVFQSAYVLLFPWIVWPFALVHIVWLVYRIRITMTENNEGMLKKYEDMGTSLMSARGTSADGYFSDEENVAFQSKFNEGTRYREGSGTDWSEEYPRRGTGRQHYQDDEWARPPNRYPRTPPAHGGRVEHEDGQSRRDYTGSGGSLNRTGGVPDTYPPPERWRTSVGNGQDPLAAPPSTRTVSERQPLRGQPGAGYPPRSSSPTHGAVLHEERGRGRRVPGRFPPPRGSRARRIRSVRVRGVTDRPGYRGPAPGRGRPPGRAPSATRAPRARPPVQETSQTYYLPDDAVYEAGSQRIFNEEEEEEQRSEEEDT